MCVWLISLIIMRYSLEMRGSESTKGFLSTFKAVIAHPICVIKYMGKDATFITIASTLKKIVQLYLKKVFGNFCLTQITVGHTAGHTVPLRYTRSY